MFKGFQDKDYSLCSFAGGGAITDHLILDKNYSLGSSAGEGGEGVIRDHLILFTTRERSPRPRENIVCGFIHPISLLSGPGALHSPFAMGSTQQ